MCQATSVTGSLSNSGVVHQSSFNGSIISAIRNESIAWSCCLSWFGQRYCQLAINGSSTSLGYVGGRCGGMIRDGSRMMHQESHHLPADQIRQPQVEFNLDHGQQRCICTQQSRLTPCHVTCAGAPSPWCTAYCYTALVSLNSASMVTKYTPPCSRSSCTMYVKQNRRFKYSNKQTYSIIKSRT